MTSLTSGDGPIVLHASRRRAVFLLLGSSAFVAVGAFFVARGDSLGWLPLGFFGLGLIVSIVLLVPGSTSLAIDENGIHMKHIFRLTHIRWSDVDSFYVDFVRTGVSSTKMIAIKYSNSYRGRLTGRRVAAALSGMEGAIPNQYEVSAEKLCELLNAAKLRWSNVP